MTYYQFTKLASSYATYDYTASSSRDSKPTPYTGAYPKVISDSNVRSKKVDTPHPERDKGLPPIKSNKNTSADKLLPWSNLRAFDKTISGTGFGRPYYPQPHNPFEN